MGPLRPDFVLDGSGGGTLLFYNLGLPFRKEKIISLTFIHLIG